MAWEISTPSSCLDLELKHNSNPMKKWTSEENSREVNSAKFYLVLTQRSPVDLAVPVTTFFFASSSNILKASTVGKHTNFYDLSCFSKSIYKIDSFIFIIFFLSGNDFFFKIDFYPTLTFRCPKSNCWTKIHLESWVRMKLENDYKNGIFTFCAKGSYWQTP